MSDKGCSMSIDLNEKSNQLNEIKQILDYMLHKNIYIFQKNNLTNNSYSRVSMVKKITTGNNCN